jgi:hypothetical protein
MAFSIINVLLLLMRTAEPSKRKVEMEFVNIVQLDQDRERATSKKKDKSEKQNDEYMACPLYSITWKAGHEPVPAQEAAKSTASSLSANAESVLSSVSTVPNSPSPIPPTPVSSASTSSEAPSMKDKGGKSGPKGSFNTSIVSGGKDKKGNKVSQSTR